MLDARFSHLHFCQSLPMPQRSLSTIADLLVLLDVTAESLRAKIDRKSAISLQRGHFDPKFQVEGVAPHQSFLRG